MTEQAFADPRSIISRDPLADAWGLEPGFTIAYNVTFEQSVPKEDMLYLDKAWSHMQALTRPTSWGDEARPAHRMFEGDVKDSGMGWEPWVRALSPGEVVTIAEDLASISDDEVVATMSRFRKFEERDGEETEYAMQFLHRAQEFVTGLASSARGFVYMIG